MKEKDSENRIWSKQVQDFGKKKGENEGNRERERVKCIWVKERQKKRGKGSNEERSLQEVGRVLVLKQKGAAEMEYSFEFRHSYIQNNITAVNKFDKLKNNKIFFMYYIFN